MENRYIVICSAGGFTGWEDGLPTAEADLRKAKLMSEAEAEETRDKMVELGYYDARVVKAKK